MGMEWDGLGNPKCNFGDDDDDDDDHNSDVWGWAGCVNCITVSWFRETQN